MREGWTYKPLEEVCSINYGTRVVQKKDKGSTYYVYGGGGATFMIDRYNREDCFIVSRFAMSPKCTRFVKGKFFLNDSGLSVSTNNELLSQAFLDKTLFAYNDLIYCMGKGLAQRNLDMPSFKKITIPIPPLSEQQRIVSELDLLSSIIEKKKAQLKEYDQLAQSIFYDMFGDPVTNEKGWEVKKLGEVASFKNGLNYHPKDDGFQIKCIGVGDFQNKKEIRDFSSINDYSIDEDVDDSYYLKDGDIIIVRSNGSKDLVGRNMIVYPNCQKVTYSGFCIRCRLNSSTILPIILNRILSDRGTMMVLRQEGRGCNISNINQKILSSLPIILPPLSLQQSFAKKIEAIEQQKALIQQSITETETLFNSRMDYYFN